METLTWILPNVVAGCAASAAAVVDVREYRVPNRLTVPLLVLGVVYHSFAGGLDGLQMSLLGAAFGFASLILAYAIGILGAGDVKLVAAVGAWLGLPATIVVVVVAALASVLYSFFGSLFRGVRLKDGVWKGLRENLSLWIVRLQVVGRHFLPDERVESVVADRASRRPYHLVPFAA
ncbi:MAG: A24 family peptidase, partial [Planctomycetota bacterium]